MPVTLSGIRHTRLVPDGTLDAPRLLQLFNAASIDLPAPIRTCVLAQLRAASDSH